MRTSSDFGDVILSQRPEVKAAVHLHDVSVERTVKGVICRENVSIPVDAQDCAAFREQKTERSSRSTLLRQIFDEVVRVNLVDGVEKQLKEGEQTGVEFPDQRHRRHRLNDEGILRIGGDRQSDPQSVLVRAQIVGEAGNAFDEGLRLAGLLALQPIFDHL